MYYPEMNEDNNTRTMIDTWLGYNHNYRIADGEFYDMENMSSDGYPVLIPRQKRVTLRKNLTIRGMLFTEKTLCYIDDHTFYYGSKTVDLGDVTADQTLIRFGAYILIYPLNIYVKITKNDDLSVTLTKGDMAEVYSTADEGTKITASICKSDGSDYGNVTVSETAPSNPNEGSYWLCSKEGSIGLNEYINSSWTPIATTYIRLEFEDSNIGSHFEKGDTLFMNIPNGSLEGLDTSLVNNGSIVQAIGTNYIVVYGLMSVSESDFTTSSTIKVNVERRIPKLDYICTDKNRVWGCHYGYVNGELVNEIYCTKLGEFRNWYNYAGLSTDSYAVSVGANGKWTGCISYGGYPTFFKEDAIIRIYGSYPAEYVVNQTDARGVQDGSYKSLAIIGEYLYYKAAGGVMVWDGSTPTMISSNLGKNMYYYNGVAGVVDGKYHLVVLNQRLTGYRYFVYDSQTNMWTKEDPIRVKWFSWSLDGQLYAATQDMIYGLGSTDNAEYLNKLVGEEYVEWYAQTGEFGYGSPDTKYVSRITIRAYIPIRSELRVEISYDDRPWEDVGILRGNENIYSQTLAINPYRCDRYRLRFSGHGDVRIYSMATTMESGSEEAYGNSY